MYYTDVWQLKPAYIRTYIFWSLQERFLFNFFFLGGGGRGGGEAVVVGNLR